MRPTLSLRPLALVVIFLSVLIIAPRDARAIDLAAARSGGAVLAEALRLGERRDWAAAEQVAARSGDPLIRDLVLWQKLRAGAGTAGEYRALASRRAGWPGLEVLGRAVLGTPVEQGRPGLTGAAAANWAEFSRHWNAGNYDAASGLLARISGSAHKLGDPGRWADRREALARRLARLGRGPLAYELARQHHLPPADTAAYAELEWLAGWIALRKLGDPRSAIRHFGRFIEVVETPISLGRGGYWLGRAHEALGDRAGAAKWYRAGAEHQTAFYGQLAAARLGLGGAPEIAAEALPDWSKSPALRADEVRAAVLLHYAGEEALAFWMFSHLGRQMDGAAALGALAGLGLELGQPHFAVRIAKQAARKGVILAPAYYPVTGLADYASKVEPAFAMAIARQETELNPRAVSPAGARGLMQLMPGTAKKVAGELGEPYSGERLLDDWRYNARLGQTYLAEQVARYGGSYVLAAAAYNAGPHRVDQWIGEFGDPRLPGTDLIDWIESIPFGETRNYVQRVIEGLYVYRARLQGEAGPMTIVADLSRGLRGAAEGCHAPGAGMVAALPVASDAC